MKILVYSSYFLTPVLERELEIIANHLEAGDDVRVIRCTGQLRSCLLNPRHKRSICTYCVAKFDRGYQIAGIPQECIKPLPPSPSGNDPVIPEVFETLDALIAFEYDGADLGMAVASTLIWEFNKDHQYCTSEHAARVNTELNMALHVYRVMLQTLEESRPDMVYMFNGRHSTTRPVLRACEKLGVRYFTHERTGSFERYTLRENTLPHDIEAAAEEMCQLWNQADDEREEIGARFFVERRNRVERAYASFVKHQDHGRLPEHVDKNKRNIVIFNSTLQEQVGMSWFQNRIYADEIDGLRRVFESFKGDDTIRFFLRMHPNLAEPFRTIDATNNTQLRTILGMNSEYDNLSLIPPESSVDSYALLDAADVVMVFGSTVGVEATYWGKPSILAGSGAVYSTLDCVYKPTSHEEVTQLMRCDLAPKARTEAIKYGYYEMTRGVRYRKFEQTGVFRGTYRGDKVVPLLPRRLMAYFLRTLEIRNGSEIRAAIPRIAEDAESRLMVVQRVSGRLSKSSR